MYVVQHGTDKEPKWIIECEYGRGAEGNEGRSVMLRSEEVNKHTVGQQDHRQKPS